MRKHIKNLVTRFRDKRVRRHRIFTFAVISIVTNTLAALGKIGLGLYSWSFLIIAGGLYNLGLGTAKFIALRGYRKGKRKNNNFHVQSRTYRITGIIVISTSLVYMAYCLLLLSFGTSEQRPYDLVTSLAIASITFAEIAIAIVGAYTSRRDHEPTLEAIKMTSLVSSLVSLVLVQTALFSVTETANATKYGGILGLVFGGMSVLIGVYMTLPLNMTLLTPKRRDEMIAHSHGKLGEDAAADYLASQGYTVLARNWRVSTPSSADRSGRVRRGEIDIIARGGEYIIFVEVKTRLSAHIARFGRPSTAVDKKKVELIRFTAAQYLREHDEYANLSQRIDVVEVCLNDDGTVDQVKGFKMKY